MSNLCRIFIYLLFMAVQYCQSYGEETTTTTSLTLSLHIERMTFERRGCRNNTCPVCLLQIINSPYFSENAFLFCWKNSEKKGIQSTYLNRTVLRELFSDLMTPIVTSITRNQTFGDDVLGGVLNEEFHVQTIYRNLSITNTSEPSSIWNVTIYGGNQWQNRTYLSQNLSILTHFFAHLEQNSVWNTNNIETSIIIFILCIVLLIVTLLCFALCVDEM